MRLTRQQRDDVAMLLRCAADAVVCGDGGMYGAVRRSGCPVNEPHGTVSDAWGAALWEVQKSVVASRRPIEWSADVRIRILLEAALLVEEGMLP